MFMTAESMGPNEMESVDQEYTAQQVSAYCLELDDLLARVESSSTHYQVLAVDRRATSGEIRSAYLRAAALLNPSQFGLNLPISDDSLGRVDQAFEKISRAFAMLVSFNRRSQYDESLREDLTAGPPSIESKGPSSDLHRSAAGSFTTSAEHDAISINRAQPREVTSQSNDKPKTDRRKSERFRLSIPVLVTGYERGKGKWKEFSQTIDVSKTGVMIKLTRQTPIDYVLHLTMPMPAELRSHAPDQPRYGVYALVRRVEPPENGRRVVGLEFLGEEPPPGYLDEPCEVLDANKRAGVQRRRVPRDERVEEVVIDYLSQTMEVLGQEETFTENVSSKGLRVMIEAAPDDFELVRVRSSKRGFDGLAAVSSQYIGKDRVQRLCLRFLDSTWPM